MDTPNIKCDISQEYYDLKRVAENMYDDRGVFLYVLKEEKDNTTFISTLASLLNCEYYGITPRFTFPGFVVDLVLNIRKAFTKTGASSLNKVYDELMKRPKDDIVMGFIESLSKQSPERQKEIIAHVYGNRSNTEARISIEIIKRGKEQQKNKDHYDYYVCFRKIGTDDKRIAIFENHTSAAIYAMYLIDRYIRKDECKPIDVTKNTDILQHIYNKMFNLDDKIKGIKLGTETDKYGNIRSEKLRLSQYYTDINKVISEKVHDWDYTFPYRCNYDSIIRLSPKLISIPKELIPEEWAII